MDRGIGLGEAVEDGDPELLALGGFELDILPEDDLHADVGVGADGFDDGARIVSGTEDIDALAEELMSADPFVDPAQQQEGGREQGEAEGIDEGTDGDVGIEVEECGEDEAVEAQHQQDAEVDLLAGGDDSWFVEVEVVGEEERDEGDEGDLEQALLVLEGDVGVGAEHDPGCE